MQTLGINDISQYFVYLPHKHAGRSQISIFAISFFQLRNSPFKKNNVFPILRSEYARFRLLTVSSVVE